jgi:hypothetical protein
MPRTMNLNCSVSLLLLLLLLLLGGGGDCRFRVSTSASLGHADYTPS